MLRLMRSLYLIIQEVINAFKLSVGARGQYKLISLQ